MPPNNYQSILSQLSGITPSKRKVFISYHHQDQAFIENFRASFGAAYEVFTDCSLDEAIESNDLHYVNRTIREDFITGTSITIVICGTDTWRRKCVDWEIYSTLHKDHALLGIVLPHVQPVWRNGQQVRLIPDRLAANTTSGYAHWIEMPQNPQELKQAIDHSVLKSTQFRNYKSNSDKERIAVFGDILTIGFKNGSLVIAISYLVLVFVAVVIFLLVFWRRITGYFKSDVQLEIKLGGIAKVSIKPNYEVKQIAHQVWVELNTRKAGLPIDKDNDVISDIYKSWYQLFGEIRILTRNIPASKLNDPNTRKLVELLIDTLNDGLRPHLTKWRAKYEWWYEKAVAKSKEEELTPQDIQSKYPEFQELVDDMLKINKQLVQYTKEIKKLVDA